MMRVEKTQNGEKLVSLPKIKLAEAEYKEREHLQSMIVASPDVFFGEIGEELLVVGQERQPRPDYVGDRIDLLALDPSGSAVIIELKRDRDKLQLLQSLTYAAMVRTWTSEDFAREYQTSNNVSFDEAQDAINQFLGSSFDSVNARQRVILVAEHFDFEVLATAEWLAEGYGVEIKCVKIALRCDGQTRYMSAETIFPSSPLFEHAWKRKAGGVPVQQTPAVSWEEVCERIKNPDVKSLALQLGDLLPAKDLSLKYGAAYIRAGDKRRVNVELRSEFAYIWQERRFYNDREYWLEKLGQDIDLQEVKKGQSLRFYLRSADECNEFLASISELNHKFSPSVGQASQIMSNLLATKSPETDPT